MQRGKFPWQKSHPDMAICAYKIANDVLTTNLLVQKGKLK